MTEGSIRLSTQVLQELFVTLTRKARSPWPVETAIASIEALAAWPLFVVDFDAIRDAAELTREASVSFWDALIITAAAGSRATTLFTEDMSHGAMIGGVQIHNPFHAKA